MKTFICIFWIIVSFFIIIWEFDIINEKSAEIDKLNLRPNAITTCIENKEHFYMIYVKFNDDTTRKDEKYALKSYQHITFNSNGCRVTHSHLNYINPYDAHFDIDDFDNKACEKIKRLVKSSCDIKY